MITNPEIAQAVRRFQDAPKADDHMRLADKKRYYNLQLIMQGMLLRGFTTVRLHNQGRSEDELILPTFSFLVEHPQFLNIDHRQSWTPPPPRAAGAYPATTTSPPQS